MIYRLNVRHIDYPQTKDAIAMVSKLTYEEMYDKALRYIFGRTLICRNLEVATQLARTTGLDCVTLDGDQVSSKGSLTGGYFNKSRSRLEIQKTRSEKSEEITQQVFFPTHFIITIKLVDSVKTMTYLISLIFRMKK